MSSGDGCWNCACTWCTYQGKYNVIFNKCFGYIKQIPTYYSDSSEVKHPIDMEGKVNKKVNYCYSCGTTVRNQIYCHMCGKRLVWK